MVQSMTVSFLHTCAQSQLPELLILYIYNNKKTLRLLADLLLLEFGICNRNAHIHLYRMLSEGTVPCLVPKFQEWLKCKWQRFIM